MGTLAAFGVAAFAIVWLMISHPDPQGQVLNLFHTSVPFTLGIGAGGMWLALRTAREEGWSDRAEGLAALSLLALAWGNYGAWAAVRRAAQLAGHEEAARFDTSPYRLATGAILVASTLLVVRWLTRRQLGEWGWAAIAIGWAAVVVLGQPYLLAALVWVYETAVM